MTSTTTSKTMAALRFDPRNLIAVLATAGIALAFDLATKQWAIDSLRGNAPIKVNGFWNFRYVENHSSAFNLTEFIPYAVRHPLLIGITLIAVVIIGFMAVKTPREQIGLRIAYALLIGGALGNLTDRLRLGYVVDFVDWHIGRRHWPAWNIADAAIVIGVILVFLLTWHYERALKKANAA